MISPDYDAAVVGGGFYGCSLAEHLRREYGQRVVVLEKAPGILQRASFVNQARVHGGYHYPRSILTGLRSRANFQRFVDDFKPCIEDAFGSYYPIARRNSMVTAGQFEIFCQRIGAPIEPAPEVVQDLFNPDLIEGVFAVEEYVFDAERLAALLRDRMEAAGVEVALETEVERVRAADGGALEVSYRAGGAEGRLRARRVFNCTYSRLNKLLVDSQRPALPLKHELTEMALVEVPPELENMGITVMCGPFFSLMPFPPRGLHLLSHVRYTPHLEWHDVPGEPYHDPYERFDTLAHNTNARSMIKDAGRYLPLAHECRHVGSLWEVKTVLPRSEVDDSRPILMVEDAVIPNLVSIMGSKVDNVYDALDLATRDAAGAADRPAPVP